MCKRGNSIDLNKKITLKENASRYIFKGNWCCEQNHKGGLVVLVCSSSTSNGILPAVCSWKSSFLVQAELIQSSSGRIRLVNMAKFCKSLLGFCLFVQGHVCVSMHVHTCAYYFFNIYFIIYLFGYARSQVKHVVSSSMTRVATRAPYIGSLETQPLDYYGSPSISLC